MEKTQLMVKDCERRSQLRTFEVAASFIVTWVGVPVKVLQAGKSKQAVVSTKLVVWGGRASKKLLQYSQK
jgi:hypothetical protein